jgi:RNA-directed DNA polymerase
MQVIQHMVEFDGEYKDIYEGIFRGCPISPLLAAVRGKNVYYLRYRDDLLILTKTRGHNRKAVKLLNQIFNTVKVEKYPDKTYLAKVENKLVFRG